MKPDQDQRVRDRQLRGDRTAVRRGDVEDVRRDQQAAAVGVRGSRLASGTFVAARPGTTTTNADADAGIVVLRARQVLPIHRRFKAA